MGSLPSIDAVRSALEELGGPAPLIRSAFEQMAAARGMRAPVEVGAVGAVGAVSFADLDVEQLGYLYEGLLEAGSRKHAGAHYTPRALAHEVVHHALEPLVDGASSADLLDLRVVDIAAGSGVFLIAAAEYLAARLEVAWGREGVVGRSALREVVTSCLYGADINPLAVEICRRSLWLLAGDPSLPLTFLDDRVLCGNSLLGLVDADDVVARRVGGVLVADAVVASALGAAGRPEREVKAASRRLQDAVAAEDADALAEICEAGLTPTVPTDYDRWQPLHWALAVPEVMARGGFDAVVGNPPFLGVKSIRGALGQNLRDHLAQTLLGGGSGRSDLAVFFLARATGLSRRTVGLVLTAGSSEGDSARFGTAAAIARGFRIYRAETSRPWPSDAGVRISLVWLDRGAPAGTGVGTGVGTGAVAAAGAAAGTGAGAGATAVLDGREVAEIGPGLGWTGSASAATKRLPPAYIPHGYQASIVLGKSLLLTREQAAAMIAEDQRAAGWIREYLSGDDLVSSVGPLSSRLVLDVGDVDAETWGAVPPVARHLNEIVLPERTAQWARYPHLVERWWRFHNRVDRLYDEMAGHSEVIALAKHAKYIWPVLVPVGPGIGPVISNGAIVYPTDDFAVYGFLASEPHRLWAVEETGSRLNQSHRYNPSRLLTTYPFPESIAPVRGPGERLAGAMGAARDQLGLGVTDLLNQVHSAPSPPVEIERIRSAIAEVDRAVLEAHGFAIDLEHQLRSDGDRTWFGLDAATTGLLRGCLVGDRI